MNFQINAKLLHQSNKIMQQQETHENAQLSQEEGKCGELLNYKSQRGFK